MIALGHAALLAFILLGIILFRYYPGHRLVMVTYVCGVLFLPEFGASDFIEGVPRPLSLPGIRLTKANAIALGLLTGSLLFDRRRWYAARPRWFDFPMLAWCAGPVVSSVANSLVYDDPVASSVPVAGGSLVASWLVTSDLYDGVVRALDVAFTWGVPYCLGRLYVTDSKKLKELVTCVVAGAAVYVPLCLLEKLMSPQLHRWVYGFHQHEFGQSIRLGGYRPMVFLEHGLAVGFWMVVGALAAVWLWLRGPLRKITCAGRQVNGLWLVIPLGLTAVACKSTGALTLGLLGLGILLSAWAVRQAIPALVLLCVFPLYVIVRTEGAWDAQEVVGMTGDAVGEDRAQSLEFRFQNENALVGKALERPIVGWGGWGRSRIYDPFGRAITIADGLWILTLGERGLLGLVTLGFVLLLPVARVIVGHGARPWTEPSLATTAVATVIVGLYSIDCLLNAMLNPVFFLLAGSLMALPVPAKGVSSSPRNEVTWRVRPARRPARIRAIRVRSRVGGIPGNRVPDRRKTDRSERPPTPGAD